MHLESSKYSKHSSILMECSEVGGGILAHNKLDVNMVMSWTTGAVSATAIFHICYPKRCGNVTVITAYFILMNRSIKSAARWHRWTRKLPRPLLPRLENRWQNSLREYLQILREVKFIAAILCCCVVWCFDKRWCDSFRLLRSINKLIDNMNKT